VASSICLSLEVCKRLLSEPSSFPIEQSLLKRSLPEMQSASPGTVWSLRQRAWKLLYALNAHSSAVTCCSKSAQAEMYLPRSPKYLDRHGRVNSSSRCISVNNKSFEFMCARIQKVVGILLPTIARMDPKNALAAFSLLSPLRKLSWHSSYMNEHAFCALPSLK